MVKKTASKSKRKRLNPDTVGLIKQIVLGVLIVALFVLIIVGIWYGTRAEQVTIDSVTVSGGETISHEEIEAKIWATLEGEYLKLVPRRFAYLYPRNDILAAVASIPRVKDIELKRTGAKKIDLTFTEYTAIALWCSETDQCYFLDESTFAFAVAPELEGGSFLRYVSLGTEPEIGKSVLTALQQEELDEIIAGLEETGWEVEEITVDTVGDAYLDLVEGGEIKVSLQEDGLSTISNFNTVLASENFDTLKPGSFQYIDLRFGDKVFVNRSLAVATSTEQIAATFSLETETVQEAVETPVEATTIAAESENDEVGVAEEPEVTAATTTETEE